MSDEQTDELKRVIAELRAMMAESLPGDWSPGEMRKANGDGYASHLEMLAAVGECIAYGGLEYHGVHQGVGDATRWICHTGNGPRGAHHAKLIATMWMWLPGILSALEERL